MKAFKRHLRAKRNGKIIQKMFFPMLDSLKKKKN